MRTATVPAMPAWGNVRRPCAAALLVSCCLVLGSVACSSDDGDAGGGSGGGPTSDAPAEAASGGEEERELRLLSYNVAGLPAEVSDEDPETNLPLIAAKLDGYDLVLTQEDFDWWKPDGLAAELDFTNYHDRLVDGSSYPHLSTAHPGPEAVGLPAARLADLQIGDGLATFSQLPLVEGDRVPWDGCFGGLDTSDGGAADCLAMKGFAVSTILDDEGTPVDVYNLHGEAGGSDEDQRLQAENWAQLAAYIAEHSEGRAILLAGDTNLHTDPPGPEAHEDSGDGADLEIWTRFLEATGLTDACVVTECDGPGRIDKAAFRSSDAVRIDATSHAFLGDEFVDAAGEALSDHEPLAVTFRLTPA